jgi:hypothetical integral membrane protein (TIGR02206 family)
VDFSALWRSGAGQPFALFSASHFIALGVLALLVGSLWLLRGPERAAARAAFRITAAGLLIVVELLLHLWAYTNGQWSVRHMLPLQLCSVAGYLSVVMLLTQSRRLYQYVYFLALGGGLPALLTPSPDGYGFPHFRFWEYFISHVLIVCAPLYMTVAEGCRPRPGSVPRVIVAMNLYLALAAVVNWLLGSNYLFLAQKPAGATLFDLLGPWPWYVVSLEVLGVSAVLLLYAPFALRDWLARRDAPATPAPGAV